MEMIFSILTDALLFGVLISLLLFSLLNLRYGFLRAARLALLLFLLSVGIFILSHDSLFLIYSVPVVFIVISLSFLVPFSRKRTMFANSDTRYDERDISFARHRLKPGTADYKSYYEKRPEKEENDKKTRALPGLLAEDSKYFHRLNSAAADASFFLLHQLKDSVDGPVAEKNGNYTAEQISSYLHSMAVDDGATIYGTALIKPEHYYSNRETGTDSYGKEIPIKHKYAIVLGSEMKPRKTATAPMSPEVVETGRRYVDCAVWAVQTASFIRSLGYSARAHIDGNYQVIPPLLANEAGLGGFGWSSLFLTMKHGPRVRYSVVTTDLELPLQHGKKQVDFLSFCNICRKCASCCPSRAINQERLEKLNSDRCFMYWNAVGTDCGKCLAVCPMGHPWGILKTLALRSMIAARLLKSLDDLFYGRRPRSLPIPRWMEKTE